MYWLPIRLSWMVTRSSLAGCSWEYTQRFCASTPCRPSVTWIRDLPSSNQLMRHYDFSRFRFHLSKHHYRHSLWWRSVREGHLMTLLKASPAAFSKSCSFSVLMEKWRLGNHSLLRWELIAKRWSRTRRISALSLHCDFTVDCPKRFRFFTSLVSLCFKTRRLIIIIIVTDNDQS